MTHRMRFGKKLALPSTAQIKHELRLMIASDAVAVASGKPRLTLAEVAAIAGQPAPQI